MSSSTETSDAFFFGNEITPLPMAKYKRPLLRVEGGKPGWLLTDEMGVAHYLTDGAEISDAAFCGWDISGILLRDVRLDTVSFLNCDVKNTEFLNSNFNRVLVDGGTGGLVINKSSCRDVLVRKILNHSSIFRFFGCELTGVVVTDCEMGIGVAQCNGNLHLQNSHFCHPTLFRHNYLRESRVFNCRFKNAEFKKNLWSTFELSHVWFEQCRLDGNDWSLSTVTEVEFNKTQIRNLQVDGCTLSRVRLLEGWAQRINLIHTSVMNLEVVGGEAVFSLTRCTIETFAFWKVRQGSLLMEHTFVLGLRLCDSRLSIAGTFTTWWAPVMRQSRLFGDGTQNITVIAADVSRCEMLRGFGKFLN